MLPRGASYRRPPASATGPAIACRRRHAYADHRRAPRRQGTRPRCPRRPAAVPQGVARRAAARRGDRAVGSGARAGDDGGIDRRHWAGDRIRSRHRRLHPGDPRRRRRARAAGDDREGRGVRRADARTLPGGAARRGQRRRSRRALRCSARGWSARSSAVCRSCRCRSRSSGRSWRRPSASSAPAGRCSSSPTAIVARSPTRPRRIRPCREPDGDGVRQRAAGERLQDRTTIGREHRRRRIVID